MVLWLVEAHTTVLFSLQTPLRIERINGKEMVMYRMLLQYFEKPEPYISSGLSDQHARQKDVPLNRKSEVIILLLNIPGLLLFVVSMVS